MAALGDVDELNSAIGLLLTETLPEDVAADLLAIQHDLFDMGAELCIPGHAALKEEQIARLGARLAHYNAALPPPCASSSCPAARVPPRLRVARATCRRAERAVVALARTDNVNAPVRQYLNRLSDLLFVLARHLTSRPAKPMSSGAAATPGKVDRGRRGALRHNGLSARPRGMRSFRGP